MRIEFVHNDAFPLASFAGYSVCWAEQAKHEPFSEVDGGSESWPRPQGGKSETVAPRFPGCERPRRGNNGRLV